MREIDFMRASRECTKWAAHLAPAVLACSLSLGCQDKVSATDSMEPAPEPAAAAQDLPKPAAAEQAATASATPSAEAVATTEKPNGTSSNAVPIRKSTSALAKNTSKRSPAKTGAPATTGKKEVVTQSASAAKAAEPKKVEEPAKPAFTGTPCRQTSFKFAAVRSACQTGGVTKAKNLMKFWTKKAKEKTGKRYKCSACHSSTKTYANKPTGAADLNAMLKAMK